MLDKTRIMFVDDEEFLLELIDAPLRVLCQSVQFFSFPNKAMDELRLRPETFDLIISDFAMPEMVGTELIAQAKRLKPELYAVLATGHASYDLDMYLKQQNWQRFALLQKPYSTKELESVVRKLLSKI